MDTSLNLKGFKSYMQGTLTPVLFKNLLYKIMIIFSIIALNKMKDNLYSTASKLEIIAQIEANVYSFSFLKIR